MKKSITTMMFGLLVIFASTLPQRAASNAEIPYPEGYRKWVHVGSTLIGPQSPFFANNGGIHHIYANEKALQGYESGKFPDGSIIVFDLLAIKEVNGATIEASRQRIDVMVKDAQRFAGTGGWGFERFMGESGTSPALNDGQRKGCAGCHERVKAQDFVFSKFRR